MVPAKVVRLNMQGHADPAGLLAGVLGEVTLSQGGTCEFGAHQSRR